MLRELCIRFPVLNAQLSTYGDETGRTLKVCMAEHRRAVKNMDHKNRIAMNV